MPRTGWTPSIVPIVLYGADQTVYLVVYCFGRLGTAYRETDIERSDLETVITNLMSGQFNDPIRIVAFNTLEHWAHTRRRSPCARYCAEIEPSIGVERPDINVESADALGAIKT